MIKAENIATKEFRKSLYGYDCEQVDRYLDELIVQLRQMEQERLEMATTIEYLVSQVQGDPIGIPEADEIVAPISPHELLTNTGRRRLEQSKAKPAEAEPEHSDEA
ncbi:MAG: DivIVA domain-containing protein [Clostridia bacterium]|nr:DivIVA domain-containing protein [Clostridia bacterium]